MKEAIVNIKLKDLNSVYDSLKYVQDQNLKGVKFNYVIARIIVELQKQKEALEEAIKPSEEFQRFEQERAQLLMKYAEKDENGNLVFQDPPRNSMIKIREEDKKEFDEEMNELFEKYDEVIKEREAQLKEFEEKLAKDNIEIKVPKLEYADLPEDIDAKTMEALVKLDIIEME